MYTVCQSLHLLYYIHLYTQCRPRTGQAHTLQPIKNLQADVGYGLPLSMQR